MRWRRHGAIDCYKGRVVSAGGAAPCGGLRPHGAMLFSPGGVRKGSGAFRTLKRGFSHPFRKKIWWFRGNSVPLQPQKCLKSERREGAIAQLVEQRTENPCVPGSIPGGTTHEALKRSQSVSELRCSTLRLLVLR